MRSLFVAIVVVTMLIYVQADTKKSGKADLTNYETFPDPDGEECKHNWECSSWAGRLAFLDKKQTFSWVKSHNIIAVHHKNASEYKLKTFNITQGGHHIEAKVYDECDDRDCAGCCTRNSKNTGFLIDMDKFTFERFGGHTGVVDWECIDC